MDEFAEAAIARELAAVGAGLGDKLTRSSERLKTYTPVDLERDIKAFAQSEVEIEDPLQAHRVESSAAYGIGALFGDSVERRALPITRVAPGSPARDCSPAEAAPPTLHYGCAGRGLDTRTWWSRIK